VIIPIGLAKTWQQRPFAFEPRGKEIGSSGLVQEIGALLPKSKVASLESLQQRIHVFLRCADADLDGRDNPQGQARP
jgi:hypothetical protein